MPLFSYTQFTKDSEDMNVPGSQDPTKPSEGWRGQDVNNALRATNSALRNLGDAAAKLPLDGDGNPSQGPDFGRVGTLAFQQAFNEVSFTSLGNCILNSTVRGSAGRGVLLSIVCNVSEVDAVYAEQRLRGFDLCDGRTTTNPYPPGNTIIMPNFMNTFLHFPSTIDQVNTIQFGDTFDPANPFSRLTTTNGQHSHAGVTGGTALSYDALPPVATSIILTASGGVIDTTDTGAGNERGLQLNLTGGSGTHAHVIGADGNHNHAIDVRPRAICCLPFLRVW